MGLVPLRPLIFHLISHKIDFGKITLIAGFKSSEHLLFEQDLAAWRKKLKNCLVVAEYVAKGFDGQKGMITDPIDKLSINPNKTIALLCGPEVMVPFCNTALTKKGLSDDQIYVSYERRMECGIGICQHCNLGKYLVCKDGPVFRWDTIEKEIGK